MAERTTNQRVTGKPSANVFRRRSFLLSWLVFGSLITIWGSYSYFERPVRVKLGANLVSFERLTLTYGGNTKDHFSPLSGSWKEQEAEIWRGVTFATRRLAISRTGVSPLTAYVVTAPTPGHMYFGGPWIALPVSIFGPIEPSFDPIALLAKFKAQMVPDTSMNALGSSAQYAVLVSDGPVHVNLLGDTPVGAWIPMGSSSLAITPRLGFYPSSANIVDITESYKEIKIGVPREKDAYWAYPGARQSNSELSTLDVLGKRILIWTDSPNSFIWVWRSGGEPRVANVVHQKAVIGLVVDPIFNARITVIPTTQEALARFRSLEPRQMLPQPEDWLGVSEAGSISVRVDRTEAELREFDGMAERLRVKDKLEKVKIAYPLVAKVAATGQDVFTYEPYLTSYRYPPSPPARGFNVFGQMARLQFEGATGSVVLGSRVVGIPAPSTLEFRGIESFKAVRGLIPIAVSGAPDGFDTTLTFSGMSEAWLNGEPMTRTWDRFSWSWSFVAILAGIIQAIGAAVAIAVSIGRRSAAPAP
jgi:hypothetical protein